MTSMNRRSLPRLPGLALLPLLRFLPLWPVALVLAGCVGHPPPMHYYTLSDVPPSQPAPVGHGTAATPPPTRLGAVAMPGELDRLQLVTHDSANEVRVHEYHRWAAPLDEQLRRTLSDDLAARVPVYDPAQIVDPDAPATKGPHRTLTVSLARLGFDAQCGVTLDASWTVHGGGIGGESGSEQIHQPATGGDCPAVAAATLSQAIAVLADRLTPVVMKNFPPETP